MSCKILPRQLRRGPLKIHPVRSSSLVLPTNTIRVPFSGGGAGNVHLSLLARVARVEGGAGDGPGGVRADGGRSLVEERLMSSTNASILKACIRIEAGDFEETACRLAPPRISIHLATRPNLLTASISTLANVLAPFSLVKQDVGMRSARRPKRIR